MKLRILVLLLLISPAFGQSPAPAPAQPQNIYAVGVSYNPGSKPCCAGTALFAHAVDSVGTYAFTAYDAVPRSLAPFSVTSNVGAGVAQKVFSLGKANVYVPVAAGFSWSGSNTGWQWSSGALVSIPFKGSFRVMPNVRIVKSSVNANSGYQPIVGVLVGWGK